MEKNFNLLIANDNEEESKLISEKLTKDNSSYMIEITKSGKEAIDFVKAKEYDIVVLDLVLEGSDGFEVIETIKNAKYKSKIIVITSLCSETFMNKAISMGVDYYILKPISIDVLSKRIKDLIAPQKIKVAGGLSMLTARELEERITNIFITVGIPAHIKGYQFLREAIKLAMEDPDIINSITKKLYPSIAEKFDTSASKVERAIRHAIEVAWNRGKIENINSIFGLTIYENNEKPTNGEFIALVADKMLLDVN
jgi:two-component system response regulator (stage 0 sporulation protein A)